MSDTQTNLLQEQLAELVKVGVGGKHRNTEDYTKKIQEEFQLTDEAFFSYCHIP